MSRWHVYRFLFPLLRHQAEVLPLIIDVRMGLKLKIESRLSYQHSYTSSSHEDGSRKSLAPVIDDLCLEFKKADAAFAKEVDSLYIDLTELVWRIVECVIRIFLC